MDLYVTTSRGKQMESYFNHKPNSSMRVIPGASIERLTDEALQLIHQQNGGNTNFIYLIGGLPDTTEKITDHPNYQEVIYSGTPSETVNTIEEQFKSSAMRILQSGAVPCLATVAPMSFETWNNTRLHQGKTSHLIHHHHYEDMQSLHQSAIIELNRKIIIINQHINVQTPLLASHIIQKRGLHQGHRFRANRLVDGCHPNQEVIDQWVMELNAVALVNRRNPFWSG